jgi:hypothetical protein
MSEAIFYYEIGMSRKIIEKGWNIGCLMYYYKDIDFTFKTNNIFDSNFFLGDVMFQNYQNVFWTKYELVFIKGNRGISL